MSLHDDACVLAHEPKDVTWRDSGLCRLPQHSRLFREEDGRSAEIKAVCDACPVRRQCLAHALAQNEASGVWGGVSTNGRRRMRRKFMSEGCCRTRRES